MKEIGEINKENLTKNEGVMVVQCRAEEHCLKSIVNTKQIAREVIDLVNSVDLDGLIRQKFGDKPAKHHIFSIVFSGCPNGCSRPQIQDIGIIAVAKVAVDHTSCIACMRCVSACKENAIFFNGREITIDQDTCIGCGDCVYACPVSAIAQWDQGYRILVGGRLGRHPRLAEELYGFVSEEQLVSILERIVSYFRDFAKRNERLADLIARNGIEKLREYLENP